MSSILLMIEILHGLLYPNCRKCGSTVYIGSCRVDMGVSKNEGSLFESPCNYSLGPLGAPKSGPTRSDFLGSQGLVQGFSCGPNMAVSINRGAPLKEG